MVIIRTASPKRVLMRNLFVFAFLSVFCLSVVGESLAQPKDIGQSLETKAKMYLKIADEQYDRGLYTVAEKVYTNLSDNYSEYISSSEMKDISAKLVQCRIALAKREKIAEHFKISDSLIESGRLQEAKFVLFTIENEKVLSEIERRQIAANIAGIDEKIASDKTYRKLFSKSLDQIEGGSVEQGRLGMAKVVKSETTMSNGAMKVLELTKDSANVSPQSRGRMVAQVRAALKSQDDRYKVYTDRMESLYGTSVKLYKAGNLHGARNGFGEVLVSGIEIGKKGKRAYDYINKIDSALGVEKKVLTSDDSGATEYLNELDQAPGNTEPVKIENEVVQPVTPEPVDAVDTPDDTDDLVADFDDLLGSGDDDAVAEVVTETPEAFTEVVAEAPEAVEVKPVVTAVPKEEMSFAEKIEQRRDVRRSYTHAKVNEAMAKAREETEKNNFVMAKTALGVGLTVVSENYLILGEQLYSEYMLSLGSLEQAIAQSEAEWVKAENIRDRDEAKRIEKDFFTKANLARGKAIEGYMENAYAFKKASQYEAALGALEAVLTIDPRNAEALDDKQMVSDIIRWRKQYEITKKANDEDMKLVLELESKITPYSGEINFPENWKGLAERRDKTTGTTQDPLDAAVMKQLNTLVNLSSLTEDTTLSEAIDILKESVDPSLNIVVLWNDLDENAFVGTEQAIQMSGAGLLSVPLKTGLERVLRSVGGGLAEISFSIENGLVTIATKDSLPQTYVTEIFDISEMIQAPAGSNNNNGSYGRSGSYGGSSSYDSGSSYGGSSYDSGSSYGGSSYGGSSYGGSSYGGSSYGGSSYGGSSYGGSGSYNNNNNNNNDNRGRSWELASVIEMTVEPESWESYGEGGLGTINIFQNTLIVYQEPDVHKKIKKFIDEMLALQGEQVAIETRFLLVDENFFEEFDLGVTLRRGDGITTTLLNGILKTTSSELPINTAGQVSGRLSGFTDSSLANVSPGIENWGLNLGPLAFLDGLSVNMVINASKIHSNSKTLTAPKVVVLSGERANINVTKQRVYVTNINVVSDESTIVDGGSILFTTSVTQDYGILSTGINMQVEPTITSDKKYVLLSIETGLNEQLPSGTVNTVTASVGGEVQDFYYELPVQQSSQISTRVNVPDQGTVMLGGLTLTAHREVEAGIPVMSHIPIIGRLFTNRGEVKDKQVLLILVKPTIILKHEAEQNAIGAMNVR